MTNRKWKKESWCVSGMWYCKFYDSNGLEKRWKIISAFEQNGL